MNKINFAMAMHFHQPVGNFKEVFERVYQRCYRPFLEFLPYYPEIKLAIHISGSLLDYFKQEHPEILDHIKEMVSKGQIEIMGGSYYEPILPAIPPKDMSGQTQIMTKALKDEFGSIPKGMWIPERVWHPDLSNLLYKASMRYCILDDTHFLLSGVRKEDTDDFYFTGKKTERVAVFSSDKMLRYTIPFKDPKKTIDYFKKIAMKKKNPLLVYADDVEKFGEWPGTYEWVYTKGWLKRFFDMLMKNRDWIKLVKPSDYLKQHKHKKHIEIQEGAYEEMMEWAGGPWSNFLKKYPEADHMYKKMQYVSSKCREFAKTHKKNKDDIHWSKIELYRGQCNCGYWHGVFGGLYMYHLRSAIYNHLIAAENIIDKVKHNNEADWTEVKEFDFDGDGTNEFVVENKNISCYFDAEEGAALKELDYRPICANIVNTIARRKESYHRNSKAVEPSLGEKLVYDKYPRYSLRNYFIPEETKRDDFANASFKDDGNFANGAYEAQKKADGVAFKRAFAVSGVEVELVKDITVKSGWVEAEYKIKKLRAKKLDRLFGVEFNLTLPYLNSDRYRYFSDADVLGTLNTKGALHDTAAFGILDSGAEFETKLNFSKNAKALWYFPVETISQSQIAYQLNHQCVCVFGMWKPTFDKYGVFDLKIKWSVGQSCR